MSPHVLRGLSASLLVSVLVCPAHAQLLGGLLSNNGIVDVDSSGGGLSVSVGGSSDPVVNVSVGGGSVEASANVGGSSGVSVDAGANSSSVGAAASVGGNSGVAVGASASSSGVSSNVSAGGSSGVSVSADAGSSGVSASANVGGASGVGLSANVGSSGVSAGVGLGGQSVKAGIGSRGIDVQSRLISGSGATSRQGSSVRHSSVMQASDGSSASGGKNRGVLSASTSKVESGGTSDDPDSRLYMLVRLMEGREWRFLEKVTASGSPDMRTVDLRKWVGRAELRDLPGILVSNGNLIALAQQALGDYPQVFEANGLAATILSRVVAMDIRADGTILLLLS